MSEPSEGITLRRALTGVLGFQVLLALLLFLGDLGEGFVWPRRGADAPGFDQPTAPGDQTRRFEPTRPAGPGVAPSGPMPERLVLTERDGAWHLSGGIAPGDGARIARQIGSREGEARPGVVFLDSPGGSVQDALELGRALRAAGLATDMEDGAICLSACPYLLAAGVTRSADEGAKIGVHQHYFGENTLLPAFTAVSDIQRGQGLVMRYLDEMGVDPRLMGPALMTPPDEIYLLTRDELTDFALLTEAG
ncbi:hypothetical protein [Oceanicola sp. S124]|uniref:COG3904 family protein n=1 Tax=Oceanicola sp. S124 TaxID=1042378 RepID=UPI0002559A2A|nr:hypothetical protein [Oceanicola sp. S124]